MLTNYSHVDIDGERSCLQSSTNSERQVRARRNSENFNSAGTFHRSFNSSFKRKHNEDKELDNTCNDIEYS